MAAIVSVLVICLFLVSAYMFGAKMFKNHYDMQWYDKIIFGLLPLYGILVLCCLFFAVYFIIQDLLSKIL